MSALTEEQKRIIHEKRKKAIELRKSKEIKASNNFLKNMGGVVELKEDKTICVQGNKFIDSGGGFLIEEENGPGEKKMKIAEMPEPLKGEDRPNCLECKKKIGASFLLEHFDYNICDNCRDKEKHNLITRTDAKTEYLLKDCDLDKREPILKFILRKNPHNSNWGDMKLYLQLQIEKRALEVWGSEEELEKEIEKREEQKIIAKTKKYQKNMKALRMSVRSSLYDRTKKYDTHEHEFGQEVYNEEDDNYTRKCITCQYEETFEKM